MSNSSLNELRTKCGILDAEIKTTIHCDWLSYVHVTQAGKLGLEGIFAKAYGKPIEMEASNDTDYSFNIKKEDLSAYDLGELEEFISKGSFPDYQLRTFLVDLCNKEIIPQAHYVVRVSW